MSDDAEIIEVGEVDPAIEQEARALGWVPEEDFRGDKSKWRSAEEFVERGREILPILKKNKEELLHKNAALEAEVNDMRATLEEFKEYRKADKERMYKQAMADLKAKKKEAIETGDAELVVEIDDAIDELKETNREAPKPEPKVEQPKVDPIIIEWARENDWYAKPAMQVAANAAALEVQELFPHLRGREFLDKVTEVVKERYPDKFGGRRKAGAVEGSGETSGARSSRKKQSYENLPAEAKAVCDRFVKQGLMTKEEYVSEFDWSE